MMLITGDDDGGGGGSGVFRLNMDHYQSFTSIVIPSQYYCAVAVQPSKCQDIPFRKRPVCYKFIMSPGDRCG